MATVLPAGLDVDETRALVRQALDEDLRYGPDVTTDATVPADAVATATMSPRQAGTVAGLDVALLVLDEVVGADHYTVLGRVEDGNRVVSGDAVLTLEAPTRGLLTAERTMLNLVCHLSGIATTTSHWVDAVAGTETKIRDSRKTSPACGHCRNTPCGSAAASTIAWGSATKRSSRTTTLRPRVGGRCAACGAHARPGRRVRGRGRQLEQFDEVLAENVDLILLDNFPLWQTQIAVQRRNTHAPNTRLESSGGLTLEVAGDYARTGVDYLAVGA